MGHTKEKNESESIGLFALLRFVLIIIGVLAFGFLLINQALGFFGKIHFLKSPCDLCGELNPEVQSCIDNLNSGQASYWTPEGWTDPFNRSPVYLLNISNP